MLRFIILNHFKRGRKWANHTFVAAMFCVVLLYLQPCSSDPVHGWESSYEVRHTNNIPADVETNEVFLTSVNTPTKTYSTNNGAETEILTNGESSDDSVQRLHTAPNHPLHNSRRKGWSTEPTSPDVCADQLSCKRNPKIRQAAFGGSIYDGRSEHGVNKRSNRANDHESMQSCKAGLYTTAAKAAYTAGGAMVLGVVGYRYVRNYLKNREVEKYFRPPTPITDLFDHILLRKDNAQKDKVIKVATGDAIKNDTLIAVVFSGKGIEEIIQENGFAPLFPQLEKLYHNCIKQGQKLEIIYVSLDKSSKDGLSYFLKMPWYALPFDDWNTKRKLIKKFKLSKLPAIVLLESDGTVSNSKAYNAMLSSPNEFPWKPQTIDSLLQRGLINPKNASIDPAVLKGKKIGLYFSANWCPPCRKFSPQLVETYKALKEKKVDFEIVFVSNDESEQKFFEYFGQQMPWLAIPYSDVAGRAMLQDELEITSLPSLVILDENRQVINKNGRRAIETDLEGQNFPWVPKVVQDISESVDGLYENPSLIVFMEDAGKDTQEQVKRDLLQLAEQLNASEENPRKLSFFIVTNTNPQSVGMRRLFKLPILMQATDSVTKQNSAKPCMVFLDLQKKCYFKIQNQPLKLESIGFFVDSFQNGKLNDLREIIEFPNKKKDRSR